MHDQRSILPGADGRSNGFGSSTNSHSRPNRSASLCGERLDAEPLGRVVAGGDEGDPELAARGAGSARPARRSGRGRIPARRRRPGASRRRLTRSRPARAARARRAKTSGSGLIRWRIAPSNSSSDCAVRAADADVGELRLDLDAELSGEQRVVSDLGMGVEREVVGGERDVGVEERLEPAARLARRSRATRCPRGCRGGRRRAARRPRRRARTARARPRPRRRPSTPRRRRRPACPAARSRASCRGRAARPRRRGSRRAAPRAECYAGETVRFPWRSLSGCSDLNLGGLSDPNGARYQAAPHRRRQQVSGWRIS